MTDVAEMVREALLVSDEAVTLDEVRDALDAVARLGVHFMQWRPIEEAPKDGTLIWLWFPELCACDVGKAEFPDAMYPGFFQWIDQWNGERYENKNGIVWPTHYMPLPAAPETDDG